MTNNENHAEDCQCCNQTQKKKIPVKKILLLTGLAVSAYLYGRHHEKVNNYVSKAGKQIVNAGKKMFSKKDVEEDTTTAELEETVIYVEPKHVPNYRPERKSEKRDFNRKNNN